MKIPTIELSVKYPKVFYPLIQKSRYKIPYGGRGAGKSWTVASMFVLKSIESKIRVLCCREIMDSIKESVHVLLRNTIDKLGLTERFNITDHTIKCIKTGSEFTFIGLKRNITKMKSYEGYDYVWIEEAESVSKDSLDVLIPTIRKTEKKYFENIEEFDKFLVENPELDYPEYVNTDKLVIFLPAEIWILFNPLYEDDEVYTRYVINKPDSCIRVKCNYDDNPWFPATLEKERIDCKQNEPEKYEHIWRGNPKGTGEKIYASKFKKTAHVDYFTSKDQLFEILREKGHCFSAIDPHSKYYPACLWMGLVLNEHGQWQKIIYNEFPTFDYLNGWYSDLRKKKKLELSLKNLATTIYSYDGNEYGVSVKNRFVDSRYAKGSGGENVMTGSIGMLETWKRPENGAMVLNTPPEKIIDVQQMNIITDLEYNKKLEITSFNNPGITIMPWCKNIIHMLENHRHLLNGKGEDEKYKDFSDVLRILYAGIINYLPPSKKKGRSGKGSRGGWMS